MCVCIHCILYIYIYVHNSNNNNYRSFYLLYIVLYCVYIYIDVHNYGSRLSSTKVASQAISNTALGSSRLWRVWPGASQKSSLRISSTGEWVSAKGSCSQRAKSAKSQAKLLLVSLAQAMQLIVSHLPDGETSQKGWLKASVPFLGPKKEVLSTVSKPWSSKNT